MQDCRTSRMRSRSSGRRSGGTLAYALLNMIYHNNSIFNTKHSMLRTAALLFFATAGISLAAIDDILANNGTFKPRISVSDRYSEKVTATVDDGFVFRELVANPESIALTVVANLDGAATGVIDENTSVGITAWHFDHSAVLGDASDYKPGAKRATFPLTMDVDLPNGDTRTARVGTVTYAWTAKTLTVTVTCTNIEGAGVGDIAASDYVDEPEAGTAVSIVDDLIAVDVTFGDATGSRNVFLRGVAKNVIRGFGAPTSDDYEEFEVRDVTLQGAADVTGPAVKTTFPAKPDLTNKIDLVGTAADLQAVTLDSVTVNGVAATVAASDITDADENGVWNWNVTGIALKKGVNAVALIFSDEEGNETKVSRTYTIK